MVAAAAAVMLLPAPENLAQNRPFIRWKKIGTAHLSIIHPAPVERDAARIGDMLEYLHPYLDKTVGAGDVKSDLLLFTEYAESNGITVIPPRRMIFYNTPPQSGLAGSNDWYTLLAIHEYRHMLQLMSLKTRTALLLYALLGEQGLGLAAVGTIPQWYAEGDAVLAETLFTKSGRGRLPKFDADFRAQLLSGKTFDYYQGAFGTYREYNPLASPYLLGYFLAVKIRKECGGGIFPKINKRAMWLPLLPYRHTQCVDALTGKHSSDWYRAMLKETAALWEKEVAGITETGVKYLEKEEREDWTASGAPQYAGKDTIVVYRRGIEDPPSIVKIDVKTGRETVVAKTGSLASPHSAAGKLVVWADMIPDPRWTWRSFSDVFIADIDKGSVRRLTRKGRYFAPSISPDGKKIVAVEFNENNESSLAVLDAGSGKLLEKRTFPGDSVITPRWSQKGDRIVLAKIKRRPEGGLAVFSCDPRGDDCKQLIAYGHENVMTPAMDDAFLYYVSPVSGIDGIRAMDLKTGRKYRVVTRKFGAYHPSLSPDGTAVLFSDVTAKGHMAAEAVLDRKAWVPLDDVPDDDSGYFSSIRDQEDEISLADIPHNDYGTGDYSPALHMINVHSWTPWADTLNRELSLVLQSNDLMDTASFAGGYLYNWNENTHAGFASLRYAGWYPVLGIFGSYGSRASTYENGLGETVGYKWTEGEGGFSLSLPLDFSRYGWDRGIEITARISYVYIRGMEVHDSDENGNGAFVPVTYRITCYNAYGWTRDINPEWGQRISAGYSHTPAGSDYQGEMIFAEMTLFFPSIVRHHSIYVQGSLEMQREGEYHFSSLVLFPRGYSYEFFDLFVKGSVNYTLPLWYPDLNLYVFYAKRVYLNAYFDYGAGLDGEKRLFRSAGGELVFEGMPLGYQVPIYVGVRYAYLIDAVADPHYVGIVFGLAL